jgi:hypothetical protein
MWISSAKVEFILMVGIFLDNQVALPLVPFVAIMLCYAGIQEDAGNKNINAGIVV